jgi:chromosome segregation ATPase
MSRRMSADRLSDLLADKYKRADVDEVVQALKAERERVDELEATKKDLQDVRDDLRGRIEELELKRKTLHENCGMHEACARELEAQLEDCEAALDEAVSGLDGYYVDKWANPKAEEYDRKYRPDEVPWFGKEEDEA